MKNHIFTPALAALMITSPAGADDTTTPETVTKCFPVKGFTKFYSKFDDLKDEKKDTLMAVMDAGFMTGEAYRLPKEVYFQGGDTVTELSVAEDGHLIGFEQVKQLPPDYEICFENGKKSDEDNKVVLSASGDVMFKNTSGNYSIAEISDGIKDGKSWYKKMFGGPMSIMVPKMTHLLVHYTDDDALANITALKDGTPIPLTMEMFGKAHVISLEHLEEIGADSLIIEGGKHTLAPVPSIKKMKKFGFSAD